MKVLLVGGRPDVRSALRLLLEQHAEATIDVEVAGVGDLLALSKKHCADLILLDWELPGLKPESLLPPIRQCCPELQVIAISGRPESRRPALEAGVDAFISMADTPERLLDTIHGYLNGEIG